MEPKKSHRSRREPPVRYNEEMRMEFDDGERSDGSQSIDMISESSEDAPGRLDSASSLQDPKALLSKEREGNPSSAANEEEKVEVEMARQNREASSRDYGRVNLHVDDMGEEEVRIEIPLVDQKGEERGDGKWTTTLIISWIFSSVIWLSIVSITTYYAYTLIFMDRNGFKLFCVGRVAYDDDSVCIFAFGQLAVGIVTVGQATVGIVNVSQVGIGLLLSIAQFTSGLGVVPFAQCAFASYIHRAQVGVASWLVGKAQAGISLGKALMRKDEFFKTCVCCPRRQKEESA